MSFGLSLPLLSRRQFTTGALAFGSGIARSYGQTQQLALAISHCSLEIAPNRFVATTTYKNLFSDSPIRLAPHLPTHISISNHTATHEFVHWHGLRLPAALDGTPEESSLSIAPGATLTYTLPPQPPGLFFVHSHAMAMQDLTRGPYSGQFAPVLIGASSSSLSYDREFILTTHEWFPALVNTADDDRSLEAMRHLRIDPDDEAGEDTTDGGWDILYRAATINGHILGAGEPLRVRNGERILLRIVNASATEPLRLSLPAHRFLVLALDGYAVPTPALVEVLSLGVGERIEALVVMDTPGVWILGSPDDSARNLGMGIVIEYANCTGAPIWSPPAPTAPWDYSHFAAKHEPPPTPDHTLTFHIKRHGLGADGFERWTMPPSSSSTPVLHRNQRTRLTLINTTDEPHPMHLHRLPFELVSVAGSLCTGLRKDTVVIPPFQQAEFDVLPNSSSDAGPALLHCHNQMHMDCGLKTLLHIL